MPIGKVIALAALLAAAAQVAQAQSRHNPFLVGPSSPYYAGPGPAVPVGPTLGPEEAVAPTDLGKRADTDEILRKLALDQALLDAPSASTEPNAAPSIAFPRHRRLAPSVDLPVDLDAEIGELQAFERSLPGALIRPVAAIDPRLTDWAATYRTEAAKLRAATDRALAERSLAACGDLERAIRASRIPHAPKPGLEASASSALVWLAKGADSCSHGMRDTTSLRLGEGRQALEVLDRELPPAAGRP